MMRRDFHRLVERLLCRFEIPEACEDPSLNCQEVRPSLRRHISRRGQAAQKLPGSQWSFAVENRSRSIVGGCRILPVGSICPALKCRSELGRSEIVRQSTAKDLSAASFPRGKRSKGLDIG